MKALTVIFILLASTAVFAKGKAKAQPKEDKDTPKVEPVPGGAKADHHFWKQWVGQIEPQHFPQLPHSSKMEKDDDKLGPQTERQRYIMQVATDAVDLKNEIWDNGYYYYAYSTKDQGDFLLVVHPQYRKCFDDLRKKFDFMQWVVFPGGTIVGRITVVMEKPRQCLGQMKDTGSKLPGATSAVN